MLKVYKSHASAYLPHLATKGSACFDVHASLQPGDAVVCYHYGVTDEDALLVDDSGNIIIAPGMRTLVPVNLIFDIPQGFSLRAHPRSGLSLKKGLTLFNCEGVIDNDYVEPLFITLYNISGVDQTISDGDRIAQVELVRSEQYSIEEVLDKPLHKTDRVGGFGSTGVKV